MNEFFKEDWDALSEIQRQAAKWDQGPIVVLAGPGSGKTRVLTCRIAFLLDQSPDQKFRILGLTFTNKAADEMRSRVQRYIPNQDRRLFLSTFHSFCADILRHHGAHLNINPNFHIYSQDSDLQSVLDDAINAAQRTSEHITNDLRKALPVITRLKSRLIFPKDAADAFPDKSLGQKFATVYDAYEQELAKRNALDFNSLILKAYELFETYPAFAERYRSVYKYICVDEFQDTNLAQYRLLRSLTGDMFRNVFVVADDDQIIYQWNGASHQRIQEFVENFNPQLIQLPVNYRCPPEVVQIANKLISHNFRRTPNKAALEASRSSTGSKVVQVLSGFEDAEVESTAVAQAIRKHHSKHLHKVVVLARNRKLLETTKSILDRIGLKCAIHQRRDNFESTPLRLLTSILSLADDRRDKKSLTVLCGTFLQITNTSIDPELVEAQANLSNRDLLQQWHQFATQQSKTLWEQAFLNLLQKHLISSLEYHKFANLYIKSIDELIAEPSIESEHEKFHRYQEEKDIWMNLVREIRSTMGSGATLGAFLHELQMRPKEPSVPVDTISLMTIHSAKGKEFNHVYLIGLVEGELPSFQSLQKGEDSVELEEERRNCFVAITRTETTLTLSYADSYRGWTKTPSRFLYEMDLIKPD